MSAIRLYIKAILGGLWLAFFIPILYLTGDNNKKPRTFLSKWMLKIFMVTPKITGKPDDETGIFLLNHQSIIDIVAIEATTTPNLCWIAKEELFKIPIFGHLFKSCKMISVDRENKQGLIKLIKDAKDAREKGRPLVMFPEGTRGKDKEMLEFKAGAKLIADKLGLKVQPVVLVDSANFMDTKFSGGSKGGVLEIIYLDSFMPEGKEWLSETRAKMQVVLDEARIKA